MKWISIDERPPKKIGADTSDFVLTIPNEFGARDSRKAKCNINFYCYATNSWHIETPKPTMWTPITLPEI